MTLRACLLWVLVLSALPGRGQSRFYLYSEDVALPARVNTIVLLHVEFDSTLHVGTTVTASQRVG